MKGYDEFDISLCKLLRLNGRATTTWLAQKLGCTRKKVALRKEKLEKAGIIQGYYPLINYAITNWGFFALLSLQIKPSNAQEIISTVLQTDEIEQVIQIDGEYQLALFGWFRNGKQLQDFLANTIDPIKGIQKHYSQILLRSYFFGELAVGNPNKERPVTIELDEIDYQIAKSLFKNSRTPFVDIASSLNISTQTVLNRMNQMIKNKVISRFYTAIDTIKLDDSVKVLIYLVVAPAKFKSAIDAIIKLHPLGWVTESTGKSDIVITVTFHHIEDLWNYLHNNLAKIDGILRTESYLVIGDYYTPSR